MMTGPPPAPWLAESSVWQLTECCDYSIDLDIWLELAQGSATPILDLGCGIGRVAHHLARAGFEVTGIDHDPGVVADFNRTSPETGARATVGEITGPGISSVPDEKYDRIFAPQQLVQIIDTEDRGRLLLDIAAALSPDGIAAFALTPDLPTESLRVDLLPDVREVEGWLYSSRPVMIEADPDRVEITRIRQQVAPDGDLTETVDTIRFFRLEPTDFETELEVAGLLPETRIKVPATAAHVGSTIVTARRDPAAAVGSL